MTDKSVQTNPALVCAGTWTGIRTMECHFIHCCMFYRHGLKLLNLYKQISQLPGTIDIHMMLTSWRLLLTIHLFKIQEKKIPEMYLYAQLHSKGILSPHCNTALQYEAKLFKSWQSMV